MKGLNVGESGGSVRDTSSDVREHSEEVGDKFRGSVKRSGTDFDREGSTGSYLHVGRSDSTFEFCFEVFTSDGYRNRLPLYNRKRRKVKEKISLRFSFESSKSRSLFSIPPHFTDRSTDLGHNPIIDQE